MVEWSLANLAAWSVQAAAVVVAGAWLPARLRLGVPRTRLLLFRLLLVACVALPLAQPWHATPAAPAAQAAVGVPAPGAYAELLNTDSSHYGGRNLGNTGRVETEPIPAHGFPQSLNLTLPPLAAVFLKPEPL